MNKRQKKKTKKWNYVTARQRRKNKALCKRYPFLIPRSVWTDEIMWKRDKDIRKWSYTLAEEFPLGWWKAFGLMMCEELREELLKYNFLNKYRFVQIKEKYGGLRAYDNGCPEGSKVEDIISKYSHLSENICMTCGKPDVYVMTKGWIMPQCQTCYCNNFMRTFKKDYETALNAYKSEISEEDDGKMCDSYSVLRFSKSGDKKIIYDVSQTANKIRNLWW